MLGLSENRFSGLHFSGPKRTRSACIVGSVTDVESEMAWGFRKKTTLDMVSQLEAFSKADESSRSELVYTKLRKLLGHAATSSWWSNHLKPYLEDIRTSENLRQLLGSLPVLERADLQTYSQWMHTWVSGSDPSNYFSATSSGSTGKPVTVSKFAPSQTIEYFATELLDWKWQGLPLDKDFLVFTNREEQTPNPASIGEPLVYLGASGQVFYRTLNKQPLSDVIKLLETEPIFAMLTSATNIRQLVVEIAKLQAKPRALQFVLSFADRVDLGLRELTKEVLGAKILDRYSTEELGPLAIQCPYHEHLHVLQLNNYVEILDHNNRPCEPGQVGKVVVTALGSFAQPLIRYDIGDSASFSNDCDSEITLPVLRPEIVRMRESYIDSRGGIKNIMPDKAIFAKMASVRDFQLLIFQDSMILLLVGEVNLTEDLESTIKNDLAEITGMEKEAHVVIVPPVDWILRHKRRAVVIVDEPTPDYSNIENLRKYFG